MIGQSVMSPEAGPVVLVAVAAAVTLLVATLIVWRLRVRDAFVIARMQGGAPAGEVAPSRAALVGRRGAAPVLPFFGDPDRLVRGAGLAISGRAFVGATLAAALALSLGIGLVSGALIGVPLGVGLGLLLPIAVLRRRRAQRLEALGRQLPDALDLMARGLRVGHPVAATIVNVARTMPDPVGPEFEAVARQIKHGDFLPDAFSDLALRAGHEDVDYFAAAIRVQHGTGGNLAETIETLSQVVRARLMLRRRVKSLSAEGRLSALLLSSLPFLIYGATSIIAPDYYGAVRDHPVFLPIAAVVVTLVAANALVLRRLTRFQM